jgi:hypothetical protein
MATAIDFSALSDPAAGPLRRGWRLSGAFGVWPVWLGLVVIFVLPLPLFLLALAFAALPTNAVYLIAIAAIPVNLVVIALLVLWYLRRGSRVDGVDERLPEFAAANGLVYSAYDSAPRYPGALFSTGSHRNATSHIRTPDGARPYFDAGTFSFRIGSGRSATDSSSGFIAVQLDRNLPHMLLKADANRASMAALPIGIDESQHLSLEGDFDRHFTLYCPADYETDALYVFAPDLMALLIDEAATFDVEIVDDWLFVYSPIPFEGAPQSTWERIFRIVEVVGAKTLRQTARYSDDRMPTSSAQPPAVGRGGRRLRQRASSWSRTFWTVLPVGLVLAVGYGYVAVQAQLLQP